MTSRRNLIVFTPISASHLTQRRMQSRLAHSRISIYIYACLIRRKILHASAERRGGSKHTKPVLSQASPRPDARVGWPARRGETCKLPLYRACRWLCLLDFDVSFCSSPFVRSRSTTFQSRLSCRLLHQFPDDQHPRPTCPGKSDLTSSTPRVRQPDLKLPS